MSTRPRVIFAQPGGPLPAVTLRAGATRGITVEDHYAVRMLSYDELTDPERELWDAFPEGRWVDLRAGVAEEDRVNGGGEWGPARTVRASVVAALLLGASSPQPGSVACLRLVGARI